MPPSIRQLLWFLKEGRLLLKKIQKVTLWVRRGEKPPVIWQERRGLIHTSYKEGWTCRGWEQRYLWPLHMSRNFFFFFEVEDTHTKTQTHRHTQNDWPLGTHTKAWQRSSFSFEQQLVLDMFMKHQTAFICSAMKWLIQILECGRFKNSVL